MTLICFEDGETMIETKQTESQNFRHLLHIYDDPEDYQAFDLIYTSCVGSVRPPL